MYTKQLFKHEYFKSVPSKYKKSVDMVTDSLTGTLTKKHIEDYANYLIKKKIPFCYELIDLDNFKQMSEQYGHQAGDQILAEIGERLINILGKEALVGRVEGDEFLVVWPNLHSYDDVHTKASIFFTTDGPLRRWYEVKSGKAFITASIGSASYPDNAHDYEELVTAAEKALYRGKHKGRNCVITYVHEKHKDIDVNAKEKNPIHYGFNAVRNTVLRANNLNDAVAGISNDLISTLKISGFYFLKPDSEVAQAISKVKNQLGVFQVSSPQVAAVVCKELKRFMDLYKTLSVLAYEVTAYGKPIGTIIMTENKIHRIWQDNDITLMMMIGEILYYRFVRKNND